MFLLAVNESVLFEFRILLYVARYHIPVIQKTYHQLITPEDKLVVRFKKDHGKILEWSIEYFAVVHDRWREIVRYDNCHGFPHKHVFHLHRKEFRLKLQGDDSDIFTDTKRTIIRDYLKIKSNYIRVRPRHV